MQKHLVGIIGASGFAGIEATHLLAGHPSIRIAFLGSERWAGRSASETLGLGGEPGDLTYVPTEEALSRGDGCSAVLLATPREASIRLAPLLVERGIPVVDFSDAFRKEATCSSGEGDRFFASYGLSEAFRDVIAQSRLIANPGCYPTAVSLALLPLLRAGLLDPRSIVVNALSGTTGAGRQGSERFSFSEVADDVRAYGTFHHRHNQEMKSVLSSAADAEVSLTFTPHLLPIRRGILATIVADLARPATSKEAFECLEAAYGKEAFIDLAPSPEDVSLSQVVGTNRCRIGVATSDDKILLCSAIDNLIKGAAGQAIQNLNLMLGLEEGLGLLDLRRFRP